MKKKILIIIGIIVLVTLTILGILFTVDNIKMKKGEKVIFSTWGRKYSPIITEKLHYYENNNDIKIGETEKYIKNFEDLKIEIDLPKDWKYEKLEQNENYKYGLKLYKNNSEEYAVLYYYNHMFGVCGTERREEKLKLNNGKEAVIGYSYGYNEWVDISFFEINKNVAILNHGLKNIEANELIEIIKTININQ